jgi:hypothetical protein
MDYQRTVVGTPPLLAGDTIDLASTKRPPDFGAHHASHIQRVQGTFPPEIQRPECEEYQMLNIRSYTSTSLYAFKVWCLIKPRDELYIKLYIEKCAQMLDSRMSV